MEFGYKSDRGRKRELNEDSYLLFGNDDYVLCAIADGMGGHNAGEIASSMAIRKLKEFDETEGFFTDTENKLRKCIAEINAYVYQQSISASQYAGMGTTLTVAVVTKQRLYFAHVGDSRAYLIDDGIRQVTKDHSYVSELVASGSITEEDAKTHPDRKGITKAIGTEKNVEPDIFVMESDLSRTIFLCSDGLTDYLSKEEIYEMIKKSPSLQLAVDKLVDMANEDGGSDNITVVAVRI